MATDSYKLIEKKDTLVIELSENIDENSNFSDITVGEYSKIEVDFLKVHLMNSCGIREWVKFVMKINEDQLLVYKNCSYIIVDTLVTIPAFSSEKTCVESVQFDWECAKTNSQKMTLFNVDSDTFNEEMPCDDCTDPMTTEYDWPELIETLREKNAASKK